MTPPPIGKHWDCARQAPKIVKTGFIHLDPASVETDFSAPSDRSRRWSRPTPIRHANEERRCVRIQATREDGQIEA